MPVAHETITLREHEEFDRERCGLDEQEWADLEAFARKSQHDRRGNYRPVLAFASGRRTLKAANFVGVLSTSRGTPIEILPKIDLAPSGETANANDDAGTGLDAGSAVRKPSHMPDAAGRPRPGRPDDEGTRDVFLQMLRTWRGLRHAELPPSSIRSLRRFPMLEVFAHLFLRNLAHLARHGLARRYVRVEDNLPYLRGRLLFQQHVRENLTDRARFYVAHDEFNPNRPANRLVRSSLDRLGRIVRNDENRRLLRELTDAFDAVPPTTDPEGDWRRHSVDRTMQHYRPVMAWVRLFLFGQGLATRLKSEAEDGKKRGIVQADMYQLYAYGKHYGCKTVALVYPRTDDFDEPLPFVFHDDLTLLCLPFDVSQAESSVHRGLAALKAPERATEAWHEVVADEAS